MRIAIVDDEQNERKILQTYLDRFAKESGSAIEADQYPCGDALLNEYRPIYDIIVFDVDMPGTNGIDASRRIRLRDERVVILFVTNVAQYAINAFEVEAVDYVLKPVSYEDFVLKLRKAMRYVRRNQDEKVTLQTPQGLVRLSVREITYIESLLHYLIYHTQDGEYRVRQTISEAEKNLQPFQFARCGKSFLVNLRHVRAIEKDDVVVTSARLRISQGKRKKFLDCFAQYLGGVGK